MSKRMKVEILSDSAFFPTSGDFEDMEAGRLWLRHGGLDLHALVELHGYDSVAKDCETGVRSLRAWLAGVNAPAFDSLYRLRCIHPDFSCDKTVLRIGYIRELKGRERRTLDREPMGFAKLEPGVAADLGRQALRKRAENRRKRGE